MIHRSFLRLAAPLALLTAASAETLQDQLDAFKTEFEKKASAEKIEEYNKGVAAVVKSGMLEKALKEGDQAPDFTLTGATGNEVSLSTLTSPELITSFPATSLTCLMTCLATTYM